MTRGKLSRRGRRLGQVVAAPALLLWFFAAPIVKANPSMKLLSPTTGWSISEGQLYWTRDTGDNWSDITPQLTGVHANFGLGPVFFHDTTEGWAILSHREFVNPADPLSDSFPVFDVAHTKNSGASWSIIGLSRPKLSADLENGLVAPAHLFFLDSLHGWINISATGNMQPGMLLATSDGGQTWSWVNSPGVTGSMVFATLQDGFQVGYFGFEDLFATHDGCKTWQSVKLSAPPEVGGAVYPTFQDAPVFQDNNTGYLVVHYAGPPDVPSKLVVYLTRDTGRTWQPVKVLADSEQVGGGTPMVYSIVDSLIMVPTGIAADGTPRVASVRLDGRPSDVRVAYRYFGGMTFGSAASGWLRITEDGLLATRSGGAAWKRVRPRPSRVPPPGPRRIAASSRSEPVANVIEAAARSGGTHISRHLGFDGYNVMSAANMATWWGSSPYYDAFVYLQGSPNGHTDPILSTSGASWVTQVQTQGWGIASTWVGLQAACVNYVGNIKSFIDPGSAAAEGTSEAISAANAAAALGLSGTVIYKDMEAYSTTDSGCDAAVVAYLGAWVSKVKSLGYSAGVYGSPYNASADFSRVSPLPDEVWLAQYNYKATIWHLSSLSDSLWSLNQRAHQAFSDNAIPTSEVYGGVAYTLDRDIDDAPVAGAIGLKTYSQWAAEVVDYPDTPPNTSVYGINPWMGEVDPYVTPNYTITQTLTGIYCYQCSINSTNVGFYWTSGGGFTSINGNLGGQAKPFGVNNWTTTAGWFYPPSGYPNGEGFMLNYTTGTVTTLSMPGAQYTHPSGINDAGQVAGYSWNDSGNASGFIYDSGNWTAFNNGSKNLQFASINGIGQVAGYYLSNSQSATGFVYSAADGWKDISCPGKPSGGTVVTGINDNDQVVGWCGTSPFLYDIDNASFAFLPLPASTHPWGVSDYNVVAGFAVFSTGDLSDGFYAIHTP